MMTIYALIDPRDNAVHYIGKTNKAGRRLIEHRNEHGRVNVKKSQWLDDLHNAGQEPVMQVLETCDDDAGSARELYWIKHGREQGWPLVNKAHGYETTQAKIDALIERAHKLGLYPPRKGHPRQVLHLITTRAQMDLHRSYDAAEAARQHAARLEQLLEDIQEAAREIEPVTNGIDHP